MTEQDLVNMKCIVAIDGWYYVMGRRDSIGKVGELDVSKALSYIQFPFTEVIKETTWQRLKRFISGRR